jgi:hypothetical protein
MKIEIDQEQAKATGLCWSPMSTICVSEKLVLVAENGLPKAEKCGKTKERSR